MTKVYNTQEDIARGLANFLKKAMPNIRKTQLKFIPYVIFGIILSESVVASDIAKKLKDEFSLVLHESIIKRIKRLFVNKHFHPYDFFDKIITYVLNNYKKKHGDKRVHIIFDHMFSHDNYTVFMITMRIGKQGIPIWFRCFEGAAPSEAMQEELIKEGISYVSNLLGEQYDLIFLADRWFNSISLMEYINSLGHTYVLRLKSNMKMLIENKKGEMNWKSLGEIKPRKCSALYYEQVQFTEKEYETNIVISSSQATDTPWILATNGQVSKAIRDYSYRFGGIETLFKSQKSNGFNLEKTVNASLKYFESLYCFACIGVLYLTILGTDYSKNSKCYKNVAIRTHSKLNKARTRVMSLFSVGLTLFNLAFNSLKYIRLPFSFTLYDI